MGQDDGVSKLMVYRHRIFPLVSLHACVPFNEISKESVESREVSTKKGVLLIPFGQAVLGAHRLCVDDANTHFLPAAHSMGK